MAAQQVLFKYEEVMSAEARQWLRDYLEEFADFMYGCFFNGYNDNQPVMGAFTCLVHGEMFEDDRMLQRGLDGLIVCHDMLQRNGFLSEFNSPTYSPVSALGLAEIVNYVQHPEAVDLARACEARIWAELVSHWHTPTAMLAGPSARSYMVDSSGGVSGARMVFGHVFGEVCFVNALNSLFPGPAEMEVHHESVIFMQSSALWKASVDYHVPDQVGAAVLERPLPDTVLGTRDGGEGKHVRYIHHPETNTFTPEILSPHRNAAVHNPITAYLTADYSLGTSPHRFGTGGQSDVLFATWAKLKPAQSMADVGTLFPRYVINDRKPGQSNYYPSLKREMERGLLYSEGLSWALQKENFAVLLSRPDGLQCEEIRSLKQAVIVPCLFGEPEEIWLGEQRLDQFVGESHEPVPVFIRDGEVYLALTPLVPADLEKEAAVTLAVKNGYGVISFYNYQGPQRDFDGDEIVDIRSGFALEIASAAEAGSFEEFRQQAAKIEIADNFSVDVRHLRILYKGNDYHVIYSPHTEGVRCATINGQPLPTPKFQTQAFEVGKLPFMEEEWVTESLDWYRRLYPDN